jgi:hypothetical protein
MKMKNFQNQLREPRKASKKSEHKKGKKPPSIEINYRGLANNVTTLNESCQSKSLLKKYLNPSKVSKNKSSSLIKRFAIELNKNNKKKTDNKKTKNMRKGEAQHNIDTNLLIKSILSNETTISPKSPHNTGKMPLNRSLKKRKNSNASANFNMTGYLHKKRRGKIALNKSSKSKDKLYRNVERYLFNQKKSSSRPRDKSNKATHNQKGSSTRFTYSLLSKDGGVPRTQI